MQVAKRVVFFVCLVTVAANSFLVVTAQTFRFPLAEQFDVRDPRLMGERDEAIVATSLFEGLTTLAPDTLEVVGAVAKSWSKSTDKKTYIFYLREDARWSDGKPVVANDFLSAWQEAIAHAELFADADILKRHLNFVISRKSDDRAPILEVEALSTKALKVVASRGVPHFLKLLSLPIFFPKPSHLQGYMDEKSGKLVSNGAFRFVGAEANKQVLEKNPHYWGQRQLQLDKIEIETVFNPYDVIYQFDRGYFHWTGLVDVSSLPLAELRLRGRVLADSMPTVYFLRFDSSSQVLQEPGLRRALSLVVNRSRIQKYLLPSITSHSVGFISRSHSAYKSKYALAFDTKQALKELKALGYCVQGAEQACKPLPKLYLRYDSSLQSKKIAFALHSMWRKHLNIETEILAPSEQGSASIFLEKQWPKLTDGLFMFETWEPYSDKIYQSMVKGASNTSKRSQQKRLLQKAEAYLVQQMPVIPVVEAAGTSLMQRKVLGFYENPLDMHPLKHIYFGSNLTLR